MLCSAVLPQLRRDLLHDRPNLGVRIEDESGEIPQSSVARLCANYAKRACVVHSLVVARSPAAPCNWHNHILPVHGFHRAVRSRAACCESVLRCPLARTNLLVGSQLVACKRLSQCRRMLLPQVTLVVSAIISFTRPRSSSICSLRFTKRTCYDTVAVFRTGVKHAIAYTKS